MRLLLVLFIFWPLLELWLLVKIGSAIGALPVVALVLLSAMLGVAVLRTTGWQTFAAAQQQMRQRASPVPALVEGFLVGLAGILLILPGVLSDAAALLLLIGPLRRLLARRWRPAGSPTGPHFTASSTAPGAGPYVESAAERQPQQPVVIEGEYRREP
jgi:UPF0716 protein FxsA